MRPIWSAKIRNFTLKPSTYLFLVITNRLLCSAQSRLHVWAVFCFSKLCSYLLDDMSAEISNYHWKWNGCACKKTCRLQRQGRSGSLRTDRTNLFWTANKTVTTYLCYTVLSEIMLQRVSRDTESSNAGVHYVTCMWKIYVSIDFW